VTRESRAILAFRVSLAILVLREIKGLRVTKVTRATKVIRATVDQEVFVEPASDTVSELLQTQV
jgi:hypothetical protein